MAFAILPPYQLKQIIRELSSKIKFRRERQYLFAHVIYDPKCFNRVGDDVVFNMLLLTKHRKRDEVYLMSSSTLSLIIAYYNGFCILPVVNSSSSFNFELHLCEKYFIHDRNVYNSRNDNLKYFKFLFPENYY